MPKGNGEDRDEEAKVANSDTGKDIKKGMHRYEAKIKSVAEGEEAPPAGDSARSEE